MLLLNFLKPIVVLISVNPMVVSKFLELNVASKNLKNKYGSEF